MNRLIVTCLGFLLTATVAYADKPLQSRFFVENSLRVECEGYDLILAQSGNVHLTTYFDRNGVPKSLHVQARFDLELFREGFPDNVLYGRRADNQVFDFPGGVITGGVLNGAFIQFNLPGYGPLYFDVGHVFFDGDLNVTLVRGANHDRILRETDAVCAYFQ